MAPQTRLEYDSLPAIVPSYVRAGLKLSGGIAPGQTIPGIVAELPCCEVSAGPLAQYRKVCGFGHSRYLPVTYPHVLAFPMQMAVMTHKDFPLKLLGMIHVRNEINQHRALDANETFHIEVSVDGHRDVASGLEFDLITCLRDSAGDEVWQEVGTMLSRQEESSAESSDDGRARRTGLSFTPETSRDWQVAENIGRRYARAAGDYNPIHLSRWSAKLFGFKCAIATGMWLKARVAAALEPSLSQSAYRLIVNFKKPVFLPGKVRFVDKPRASGIDFALTNPAAETIHLTGDVTFL